MKARVYIDYYPVKIVYASEKFTDKELTGRFVNIDQSDLPDRKNRNFWKWDESKNKVVVDRIKLKAITDKKEADDALLAGIKSKLGLTDDEWEVLKNIVKK